MVGTRKQSKMVHPCFQVYPVHRYMPLSVCHVSPFTGNFLLICCMARCYTLDYLALGILTVFKVATSYRYFKSTAKVFKWQRYLCCYLVQ